MVRLRWFGEFSQESVVLYELIRYHSAWWMCSILKAVGLGA